MGTSEKSSWATAFMVHESTQVSAYAIASILLHNELEPVPRLTNSNSESAETDASNKVADEVGLAGADEGSGLAIVFVVVT